MGSAKTFHALPALVHAPHDRGTHRHARPDPPGRPDRRGRGRGACFGWPRRGADRRPARPVLNDGKAGGTVRAAKLVATGRPGTLQIRLFDPATRGEKPGLGACTGDSGAPVFGLAGDRPAIIGVVSWSTGPQNSDGCG